jgi:hypothetical protein
VLAAGCGGSADGAQVRVADVIKQFHSVEKRPAGGAFEIAEYTLGGRTLPAVAVPPTSRLVWTYSPLPRRSTLRAELGVADLGGDSRVHVRVGISDGRTYETLAERVVETSESAGGWTPIAVSLSAYGGPQWSLFYRPDTRLWEIILATTAIEGSPDRVYWGWPGIDTDVRAARLHLAQRASAQP